MKNRPLYSCLLLLSLVYISCGKNQGDPIVKTYRFSKTMTVDGRERSYTINLPPGYYEGNDFALVIAMHGGGGDAGQFESTSLLTQKANTAQFIIVYPNGVKSTGALQAQTWNAGGCCDYAVQQNIDDVKFISQLIDQLVATYKINAKKVYATGHSNGGMMSYRLACELSQKIAAIAPNGCTMVVKNPCTPARAVPVLHMHSVLDTRVPYTGGFSGGVVNAYCPPIDSVMNVWSTINACINPGQVMVNNSSYKYTVWSTVTTQTRLQYYLTQDGGHGWPGGLPGGPFSDTPSTVINANDLLWSFFQQFQLP